MRPFVWGLLIIMTLVLQATLVPLIAIKGIRPDLLLLIVVFSALLLGKDQGVGMGFFAGLLQDLASGNIFGLNILSKIATGYFAGSMERKVFKEKALLPVLAIILATIFNSSLKLLILFILGYHLNFFKELINVFYLLTYNVVLAIPLHFLVYRIAHNWMVDQDG